MFKRITSLFLAVALLISMVPAQALAVETEPVETTETAAPAETQAPTALSGETEPVETQWSETTAVTETAAPDEETEPPVTEPKEKHYTLSFAGDCTFGSVKKNWNNGNHFIQTIGENYDYPFANVRQYFENDDFVLRRDDDYYSNDYFKIKIKNTKYDKVYVLFYKEGYYTWIELRKTE